MNEGLVWVSEKKKEMNLKKERAKLLKVIMHCVVDAPNLPASETGSRTHSYTQQHRILDK